MMRVECALDYNRMQLPLSLARTQPLAIEDRTARLTILIDPRKKAVFERLCAEEDATPSQVMRRLIRRYIEERTGEPWVPPKAPRPPHAASKGARRKGARRRAETPRR
jgi:Ribbon-helix-helix protein